MTITGIALALAAAQAIVTPQATIQPAQPTVTIAPAPQQAVILSSPTDNVLRAGTAVPLVLAESINSNDKTLRVGQQVRLTVASPVMLGAMVVIPAGSPALAEITDVKHKGMWGKSGRIVGRVLNVRVGDRMIRMTGTFDDKGVTGTGGVVASVLLLPIAGFLVTGTSANIPAGSGVKAFLDEDLRIGTSR